MPPVFAILGWRLGDDVRVLGAGTLIAPKLILTARHVATSEAPDRPGRPQRAGPRRRNFRPRYRVYSPWVGIKTVKEFHFVPESCEPGTGLALAELESRVPGGLGPAGLPQSSPVPGPAWCFGFGGDRTGLLQAVPSEIVAQAGDGMVCLEPTCGLGPGDSGAPLFAEKAPGKLAGVYVGLRWSPDSVNDPRPERFAINLEPYRAELEQALEDWGGTAQDGEREELQIEPQPDSRIDTNVPKFQYDLGASETREHSFAVKPTGRTVLVVTVNATILPLRSWPRMRVRLYRDQWLEAERTYPGPVQTIRLVGRNHQGKWRIRVESESEIAYQMVVSLYRS